MTVIAEQVFRSALVLSPVDRAALIEKLFLSFDQSGEGSVDTAWRLEVEDRFDAYDSGKIDASPADDVLARISQR